MQLPIKTIYISGIADMKQYRERVNVSTTRSEALRIAREMLRKLDAGVAYVRINGEYVQVGGNGKEDRNEIISRIEAKYERKGNTYERHGRENIPRGFNSNGEYTGY